MNDPVSNDAADLEVLMIVSETRVLFAEAVDREASWVAAHASAGKVAGGSSCAPAASVPRRVQVSE